MIKKNLRHPETSAAGRILVAFVRFVRWYDSVALSCSLFYFLLVVFFLFHQIVVHHIPPPQSGTTSNWERPLPVLICFNWHCFPCLFCTLWNVPRLCKVSECYTASEQCFVDCYALGIDYLERLLLLSCEFRGIQLSHLSFQQVLSWGFVFFAVWIIENIVI